MTDLGWVIFERLEQERALRVMRRQIAREKLAREGRSTLLDKVRILLVRLNPPNPPRKAG